MAEACIDAAAAAMHGLWSQQGTMQVAMPKVAEHITALKDETATLQRELARALRRIDDQDTLVAKLVNEVSSLRLTVSSQGALLGSLTEGANRAVRRDELSKAIQLMADLESHTLLKDTVTRLQSRVSELPDATKIALLIEMTERTKQSSETLSIRQSDDSRTLRNAIASIESEGATGVRRT